MCDKSKNPYHQNCEALQCHSQEAQDLVNLAWAAKLTRADVPRDTPETFKIRYTFTNLASWAIYTVEYMNSLNLLLHDLAGPECTVLEVMSGTGLLGKLMREKYSANWIATDVEPVNTHVIKLNALDAISQYAGADVLFFSWCPYKDKTDYVLATQWSCKDKSMVVVGEYGGCTGSFLFWDEEIKYNIKHASELDSKFIDVSTWPGRHDATFVVKGKGKGKRK